VRTAKIWRAAIAGFAIGTVVAIVVAAALLWPTCGDGGLVECDAPDVVLGIAALILLVLPVAGFFVAGTLADRAPRDR
jgi:hypothetical protein